jgi:hypothetical protein
LKLKHKKFIFQLHTLEDAKTKIEAELKEAISDIDAVLDRVDD